jgi:hypothetical protein
MKNARSKFRSAEAHRRRGLAPLEMVLLTPFLVLMGALMICFGDAALWKIRAQSAVHYAGTQTESFRGAQFAGFSANPRPASWPQPAALRGGGRGDITKVQDFIRKKTGDKLNVAAVHGNQGSGSQALLVENVYTGNRLTVNRQFLAEKGVHAGTADLTRNFPMLTRVLPNNGRYRIDHETQFLTRDWYFSDLGLGWNSDRRANHLYNQRSNDPYNLEPSKNSNPKLNQLWQKFDGRQSNVDGAFELLLANPDKAGLDPLDYDLDWLPYTGSRVPPDFHPARPTGCELYLEDYIDFDNGGYRRYLASIRRVPMQMASRWLGTYKAELNARLKIPGYVPKGPLSIPELGARIKALEKYINLLRAAGF